MALLLVFMLTGVVTARFIEKKRYHVALVCHAVVFTILLLYLSFIPSFGFGAAAWSHVLGEDLAKQISHTLYDPGINGGTVTFIVAMLELFTVLQSVALAAAAARKLTLILGKHAPAPEFSSIGAAHSADNYSSCLLAKRRYITLCRCIC